MIVWLIGLAGSGKTTIGREVYALLKARNKATVMLDGDHFRTIMGDDLGHSIKDRETNGWRMARLCSFLDKQGIDVVCCVLSLFAAQQRWNRETHSRYFELYLDVSMQELERRDQKGLYSGARAGRIKNVVGIDIPFVPPETPDLVIANDTPRSDFKSVAQDIVTAIDRKSWPS
jgi:cytidine diphosphoramidate kinase